MSNTFLDARTISSTKQMVTWRNALRDDRSLAKRYGKEKAASTKLVLMMLAARFPTINPGLRTLMDDCAFGSLDRVREALDRAHESCWITWEELPKQRGRVYTLTNHLSMRIPITKEGVPVTSTGVPVTGTGCTGDAASSVPVTGTEEATEEATEEPTKRQLEEVDAEDLVMAQHTAPSPSSLAPLAAGAAGASRDALGPDRPELAMAVPTHRLEDLEDLATRLAQVKGQTYDESLAELRRAGGSMYAWTDHVVRWERKKRRKQEEAAA